MSLQFNMDRFLLSILCIISLVTQMVLSERLLQKSPAFGYQIGVWSGQNQAQPQFAHLSSQYYLCGFQFQVKTWTRTETCDCRRRWYRWRLRTRCSTCTRVERSQTNRIRMIYCLYTQWDKQIIKEVSAQAPTAAEWRNPIMCNKDYFANGISGNYGVAHGQNIGFVGLRLKCTTITYSQSHIIEEGTGNSYDNLHTPSKHGLFISKMNIRSERGNRLWGFIAVYEFIPKISKAELSYEIPPPKDFTPYLIENQTLKNCGTQSIVNEVGITKTFQSKSSWKTENTYVRSVQISQSVKFQTEFKSISVGADFSKKFIMSSSDTYGFNKEITQTFTTSEKKTYVVPSRKQYQINKLLLRYTGRVPFKCKLTYVSRTNGQFLFEQIIEGVWEGTKIANSVYQVQEKNLSCPSLQGSN